MRFRGLPAPAAAVAGVVLFIIARPYIQAHLYAWRLVRADHPTQRDAAAARLVMKGGAAHGPLERLVHHSDPVVREAVFRALCEYPLSECDHLLCAGMSDNVASVRVAAARAAAVSGGPLAQERLAAGLFLHRDDEGMAWVQALSFSDTPTGREILFNALRRHPDPCVRVQIIERLEALRRPGGLEAMVQVLGDDALCRRLTIGQRRDMAFVASLQERIQEQLGEGPWMLDITPERTVGEAAAEALRRWTGHPGPVPVRRQVLDDAAIDTWRRLIMSDHRDSDRAEAHGERQNGPDSVAP